jgi:hypothetical protein
MEKPWRNAKSALRSSVSLQHIKKQDKWIKSFGQKQFTTCFQHTSWWRKIIKLKLSEISYKFFIT